MEIIKCEICLKEIRKIPSIGNKFCSNKCYGIYRSKTYTKEKHHAWVNEVKIKCVVCLKSFYIKPCKLKHRKCCSLECRKKHRSIFLSGKNCPAYGRKVTDEQKKVLSIKNSGVNSPRWKGGRINLKNQIRATENYRKWRFEVFKRDNFTCVICSKNKTYLNADHIKPFATLLDKYNIKSREDARNCSELWDLNNGRTLCCSCHKKTDTFGWKSYNSKVHQIIADRLS